MSGAASPISYFGRPSGVLGTRSARRTTRIAIARSAEGKHTMLHAIEFIATISASLFAGAALYINLVEHPARMALDTRSAALEWAPSYQRATWMQAPLALASLAAGVGSWWMGAG